MAKTTLKSPRAVLRAVPAPDEEDEDELLDAREAQLAEDYRDPGLPAPLPRPKKGAPAGAGHSRGHEQLPGFASTLLVDVIEEWLLETGAKSNDDTLRNYRDRVTTFIRYCELPIHGPKKNQPITADIWALKSEIVQAFVWWLQEFQKGRIAGYYKNGKPRIHEKPYSRATVESLVKALRQLEAWLAPEAWENRVGYLDQRVLKRVVFKAPAADELGRRPFSDSERDALLAAAGVGATGPTWRMVLVMLMGTGMRKEELAKLKVIHVHDREGYIELPAEVVKGEVRGRNVILWDDVLGELRQYYRHRGRKGAIKLQDPLIVTREGSQYTTDGISRIFRTLQERCPDIPDVMPHRCRNTFAVNFLRCGLSTVELSGQLGHRDHRMSFRYSRQMPAGERPDDRVGKTPLSIRNRRGKPPLPYFTKREMTPGEKEEQLLRFEAVIEKGRKKPKNHT